MSKNSELERIARAWGGYVDQDGSVCGLSERAQRELESYEFVQQEKEGTFVEANAEAIDEAGYQAFLRAERSREK